VDGATVAMRGPRRISGWSWLVAGVPGRTGGWSWCRFRLISAVWVAGRAREGHAATRVPPGPGRRRAACWPHDRKDRALVLVCLDAAAAARDLAGGTLACPSCGQGRLARWGHGAERVIRLASGRTARLRPDRARCRSCRRTHMLLPSWCAPRRADGIEVIGAAAGAAMAGTGHRPIAAALGVPPGTVRGWLRRLRARASALRSYAIGELAKLGWYPPGPPCTPAGSPWVTR
jgi:transposase-like protein